MMTLHVLALSFLASHMLLCSVEGQLQAAWKLKQEGNTDNQAFISMNGRTSNFPPFLSQMLRGTNTAGDFFGLFRGGQAGGVLESEEEAAGRSRGQQPGRGSSVVESEELDDDDGSDGNGTVVTLPPTKDERPVPGSVDVGPDGSLYFKGNISHRTIAACRDYCYGFRGFRLAIAKTKDAFDHLRKYPNAMVDISIDRKPDGVKLVWGDGAELEPVLLIAALKEPIMNGGVHADKLVMRAHGTNVILDDASSSSVGGNKVPCLCQGNFASSFH